MQSRENWEFQHSEKCCRNRGSNSILWRDKKTHTHANDEKQTNKYTNPAVEMWGCMRVILSCFQVVCKAEDLMNDYSQIDAYKCNASTC